MIVCPNCNHQNPDGAVQCEACYTPLPAMMNCPSCNAPVQSDASFCGQCGFNLRNAQTSGQAPAPASATVAPDFDIPDLEPPDPLVVPEPLIANVQTPDLSAGASMPDLPPPPPAAEALAVEEQPDLAIASSSGVGNTIAQPPPPNLSEPPSKTQLQIQSARLLHLQTNTTIELPQHLPVVHIGKQNDRIPPDIDVSGFPNSEIVSRIHADIRIEGDIYYIEDVGSSNGTYINNIPLPMGNRHRLRPGDRIALGKGDKVTFLFQLS
jgi:hypothetical protein